MELLADALDVAVVWEPLHATSGVVPDDFGWGWRPSLQLGEESNDQRAFFHAVHGYELHNEWTRMMLTPRAARSADRALVKYVRANGLVDVLLDSIEFRSPPIYLLRHPIDTCLSQMRAFGASGPSLEERVSDWCAVNCPVIDRRASELTMVHYEDLVTRPLEELTRIVAATGTSPRVALESLDFARSSATDFRNEKRSVGDEQLRKNIDELSPGEKSAIQEIFDEHGLIKYSAFSATPQSI